MLYFLRAIAAVFLTLLPPTPSVFADPARPRERSFRPVVPIKQNVRGGMDQMKSQTITLTIPPPPIPAQKAPASPDEPGISAALPPDPVTNESKPADETGLPLQEETDAAEADTPPSPDEAKPATNQKAAGPTLAKLREEAHALAGKKLTYSFGADNPDSGGLDCSSTIQHLLKKIGIKDVPRTSYDQYYWLKRKNLLDDVYGKSADKKLLKKLSPGDLIFWGGTWKSGHRVSHVMLYMGFDPATDTHYVFGARGKSVKGLTGSGVDIFELDTERGRLVAHGKIPGLIY